MFIFNSISSTWSYFFNNNIDEHRQCSFQQRRGSELHILFSFCSNVWRRLQLFGSRRTIKEHMTPKCNFLSSYDTSFAECNGFYCMSISRFVQKLWPLACANQEFALGKILNLKIMQMSFDDVMSRTIFNEVF